jgi:hypothetical protein
MRWIAVGIGVAMLAMLLGSLANANAQTANTTTKTITIRTRVIPLASTPRSAPEPASPVTTETPCSVTSWEN